MNVIFLPPSLFLSLLLSLSLPPPPHPFSFLFLTHFLAYNSSRLVVTTLNHREAFRRVSWDTRGWQFEKCLILTGALRHPRGREIEEEGEAAQTSTFWWWVTSSFWAISFHRCRRQWRQSAAQKAGVWYHEPGAADSDLRWWDSFLPSQAPVFLPGLTRFQVICQMSSCLSSIWAPFLSVKYK